MNRSDWIASVHDTEDMTARAITARDRLLILHKWLGWQKRRGKLDPSDADSALEDVEMALDVVISTIHAARSYRGTLQEQR